MASSSTRGGLPDPRSASFEDQGIPRSIGRWIHRADVVLEIALNWKEDWRNTSCTVDLLMGLCSAMVVSTYSNSTSNFVSIRQTSMASWPWQWVYLRGGQGERPGRCEACHESPLPSLSAPRHCRPEIGRSSQHRGVERSRAVCIRSVPIPSTPILSTGVGNEGGGSPASWCSRSNLLLLPSTSLTCCARNCSTIRRNSGETQSGLLRCGSPRVCVVSLPLCLPSACHRCHRSPLLRATARSSEIESTEPPKA